MRPRDDRKRGTHGAGLLDYLSTFKSIRDGDQQTAGCRVVRGTCQLRIGRVAGDRLDAALAKVGDDLFVAFEYQQRYARILECRADDAAYSAIADQHDV